MKTLKLNLQQFADPVQGGTVAYLLRFLKNREKEDAKILAFQTEGSTSRSKDADTVVTKDGTLRVPGGLEVEHDLTCVVAKGGTIYDELMTGMEQNDDIEVWKVHRGEKGTGENADKYKAEYSRGFITSIEETANAEDLMELSMNIGVYGTPRRSYATLSQEQEEALDYVFQDTTKATAA